MSDEKAQITAEETASPKKTNVQIRRMGADGPEIVNPSEFDGEAAWVNIGCGGGC